MAVASTKRTLWSPPSPAFSFDFVSGSSLPAQATFAGSASGRTYYDSSGVLQTAALDTPRFDHDPVTHERLGLRVVGDVDKLSFTGSNFSDWYNAAGGTVLAEFMTNSLPSVNPYPWGFSNGSGLTQFFGSRETSPGTTVNASNGAAVGNFPLAVPHERIAFAFNANDRSVLLNESSRVSSTAAFTVPAVDRLTFGVLALTTAASFGADIWLRRFKYFTERIADEDLPFLATPDVMLIGVGDSFVIDTGIPQNIIFQTSALIRTGQRTGNVGAVVTTPNFGHNGHSYDYAWPSSGYAFDMYQDLPVSVLPCKLRRVNARRLFWFNAGTNGLFLKGNSAAQEWAAAERCIQFLISGGVPMADVCLDTVTPATGRDETKRTDFNALLRTGQATYGFKIADIALDPDMGPAGSDLNATWYRNGLHPTIAGAAKIAALIYAQFYP